MTPATPGGLTRQRQYRWLNIGVVFGSALICVLMLPMRSFGMELLGIGPSWLLIWVVAWSVGRTSYDGAIAGLILGLVQDGMTGHFPTSTVGLVLAGVLTARIQKQRFIQEDFISIAIIVFAMTVLAETTMALQISVHTLLWETSPYPDLSSVWLQHQRIALSSAILSSLWAPVVHYPLSRWWTQYRRVMTLPGDK